MYFSGGTYIVVSVSLLTKAKQDLGAPKCIEQPHQSDQGVASTVSSFATNLGEKKNGSYCLNLTSLLSEISVRIQSSLRLPS